MPAQELHRRGELAPVFDHLNTYDVTTHFNGQSTIRTLAVLAPGPIDLTVWYLYVHSRFGQFPSNYQDGNIGWPVAGWLEAFDRPHLLPLPTVTHHPPHPALGCSQDQ
ncbi:hypothetical protein [Kribbella ginsengisoli]|uniref:Uncharacterized protein n=1 Tax=Kribbella ginsengisoli TaxID=363865 RepID=A0ABP6YWL3_9ACTN